MGAIFLLSKSTGTTPTVTAPTTEPTTSATPSIQDETATQAAVTLTASGFIPATITVKTGIKVTWTNSSGMMGNVSSNPHPIHTAYPPLNLGNFGNGESVSLVFDKPGTYGYHNHLDASETGTVVVTQ